MNSPHACQNNNLNSAILLLSAPDKEGIVYSVSKYIFEHQGNIIHAEQHADSDTGQFFMRVEWDLSRFTIPKSEIRRSLQPLSEVFNLQLQVYFKEDVPKIAIFVSKTDHCLVDLLNRYKNCEYRLEITGILSNHEYHRPLADFFYIPYWHFPINAENKMEQERIELDWLKTQGVELVVLARYMQVLSEEFVATFQNRIINVHHSFLPAFVGANPYEQAFRRGVKIIGSTSHFVTEVLDDGPIIAQRVVDVSHKDTLSEFVNKGKELETHVLSYAVKKYTERKILVFQNKTIVFD